VVDVVEVVGTVVVVEYAGSEEVTGTLMLIDRYR